MLTINQCQQPWLIFKIFKYLAVLQLLPLLRITSAEYIAYNHQHNLNCIDWQQAPESAVGNCTRYGRFGALRCYGGMNNLNRGDSIVDQKVRKLEEIVLCGWPSETFNPLIDLQPFPKIRTLTIEYSGLREIIFDFPEMFFLQYINISWTNLSYLNVRTFKRVHTLKVVDLRWNQLMQLDDPLLLPRSFEHLYLAGNPWNCTRNLKWLLLPDKGVFVADREDLVCSDRKYKDRRIVTVMNYKVILKTECQTHPDLKNCSCMMHHIIPKSHIPLYTVNCSNLQLQRLPSYLPKNTTMFYANDNLITDVLPLSNNIHYRLVADVHLDNNQIESIDMLEGGYWLENFRLLSLRGNKLRKIPVYALDNALEDNQLLSQNPWFCTCKFGLHFREVLMKYNEIKIQINTKFNDRCVNTVSEADDLPKTEIQIPVYALDNALEDNHNANLLLLSQNPWFCTCKFGMHFREVLMKYKSILRDALNITCTYKLGDELRHTNVLSLTRQDVCKLVEESHIYPLDWLNAVLASCIIFILGKLAYDYYYYKNYGRVPWIVLKLP